MEQEKYKLKITCLCPKGKAEEGINSFKKAISLLIEPQEYKIIDDERFYFVYELDAKQLSKITAKFPKYEQALKKTFWIFIHLLKFLKKMKNNFNYATDKLLRIAVPWLKKKYQLKEEQVKEVMDKINLKDDDIQFDDEIEMREFLSKELIKWEVLT